MIDRIRTTQGTLRLRVAEPELREPVKELILRLSSEGNALGTELAVAGRRAWVKASPLRPRVGVRHALRHLVLRQHLPREREFDNLRWLRERLFEAVEPLAAGGLIHAGRPRFQVLVSALEEGASPFEEVFPGASRGERSDLLRELAGEISRLHALHFVHRDLFPRNLLVRERHAGRRLVLLDTWAGGPGPGLRGPAYDLACWFLEPDLFTEEETRLFWGAYIQGLEAQGARPQPDLAARVDRARRALIERLRREPGRLRGRAMPGAWTAPRG